MRYSKPRAAQFSKEGTDAPHTWAQLSLTAYEEESQYWQCTGLKGREAVGGEA